MSKIRINDLARELEVKSKAILDVLTEVGVTEKKTHSSSIEDHEAVKVREHFRSISEAQSSSKVSRSSRTEAEGIKTKIDLSHISKPGDVLNAIRAKQQVSSPPAPAARSTTSAPVIEAKPAAPAAKAPAITSPPAPTAPPSKFVVPSHGPRPTFTVPTPPAQPPKTAAAPPSSVAPPRVAAPPSAPPAASVAPPPTQTSSPTATRSAAPSAPVQPQGTPPRMIMPQTGPRPVYKAPPRASAPAAQAGAPARPAPGRPVPGQPIFQRQRPSAPANRPALRPGERRPMHPTRQSPTGTRPIGVGPGLPPGPTRPGSRPGAPSRRPGQRYVPRGVKEGPMKGYTPPPRLTLSNEPQPITRSITITEGISVKDLAEKLGIRAKDLIARLLARGVFATINQTLDGELASEMSRFFGADTSVISFEEQAAKEVSDAAAGEEGVAADTVPRPPVVTIMGHVDHGKTTLLDSIRLTNVAGGEAGAITQHIGAYKVTIIDKESPAFGRKIVFIDTPGHEAFTRMRARGAKVTDIVVLVVAAEDGVMPQTLEAIDHARAAKVPIIVAINKIDKPDAQPERIKQQLSDRGLLPEDWGGDVVMVPVSARTKEGLDLLLEMILLVAEILDLKANAARPAMGTVIEAQLDRGRGPVATVLVRNGTLSVGDFFICGAVFGKVRAMQTDRGLQVRKAEPSTPVEVLGLESMPEAGDDFQVVTDTAKAKQIVNFRDQKLREASLAKSSRLTLEQLHQQMQAGEVKELPIIMKADVGGSAEVLSETLQKLTSDKVKVRVIHSGVGAINESDVLLASASNAIVIGFNVRPERKAEALAEQEKVDVRLHTIIYNLTDEIKRAMTGLLEPVFKEVYQGKAQVRETFRITKVGAVAGCQVLDGSLTSKSEVRLLRDNIVVYTGKISSLRRFKDDVSEVKSGMECGIT